MRLKRKGYLKLRNATINNPSFSTRTAETMPVLFCFAFGLSKFSQMDVTFARIQKS